MNSPKSDKELDEWLELLSSSTHSPQGKFSTEKSYNILQQRLQPAYRKHKILSIRYTVAVAAGFVLLIGFGWYVLFLPTSGTYTDCFHQYTNSMHPITGWL